MDIKRQNKAYFKFELEPEIHATSRRVSGQLSGRTAPRNQEVGLWPWTFARIGSASGSMMKIETTTITAVFSHPLKSFHFPLRERVCAKAAFRLISSWRWFQVG